MVKCWRGIFSGWSVLLLWCVLAWVTNAAAVLPEPVFQVTQTPPAYPLLFVASRNFCIPVSGVYHCKDNSLGTHPSTGTDAMHADHPKNPSVLYLLLPNRQVKKIFPLPNHLAVLGFTNVDQFDRVAVVEPNVSVNGRSAIFTVFPNFSDASSIQSPRADLFRVDLGPLIDNPSVDPATLTVTRLTSQPTNAFSDALNPTLAPLSAHFVPGVANMHGIEVPWDNALFVDPEFGPIKVAFVSNQKKVRMSNGDSAKKNLNLYIADIGPTGALVNINQFQYYTTTSAISPQNMRDGIAFSYVGNDKSVAHWELQSLNTAGAWKPLHGFGKNASNATHLGTLCATQNNDDDGVHDVQVTASYYDGNNNGFGAILSIPMSGQGANDTLSVRGQLTQLGEQLITLGASDVEDLPARYDPASSQFLGKFSTPACGPPNQLFLSHANSYAHSNGNSASCGNATAAGSVACPANSGAYDARIIFRNNLNPFNAISDGVNVVVDDVSNQGGGFSYYGLVWPRPVISLRARFGGSAPKRSVRWASKLGLPVAQVGTSALWNTDVTPAECHFGGGVFLPSQVRNSTTGKNEVWNNIALLGVARNNNFSLTDPQGSCVKPVLPAMVGGVSIVMTDNKVDPENIDYIWERKEGKKILGVYPTGFVNQTFNGQEDHSFQAVIPANVPFSMHLLSKRYGLRLADVDSWHSLKPFEKRNDCGGCHGHEVSMTPVDINTTLAGQPSYVPADFVTQTPYVTYNSTCTPEMRVDPAPTREIPLWGNNTPLFQGIAAQCGGCHVSGTPTGNNSFAIIPNNAEATFHEMSPYLSSLNVDSTGSQTVPLESNLGAIGSSAWWAMRGERADGRANCPSSSGTDGTFWCFHPEHHRNATGGPLFCDGTNPAAATLVYDFGLWLDNNMPRERQFPGVLGYGDRYHPTVTSAVVDKVGCSIAQGLTTGFWDDSGAIASLKLEVQGQAPIVVTEAVGGGVLRNGVYIFSAAQIAGLTDLTKTLKVTAVDAMGNQQSYALSRKELEYECEVGGELIGQRGLNNPLAGGTPGAGATPTPPPGSPNGPPGLTGPTPVPTTAPTPKSSALTCSIKVSKGGVISAKVVNRTTGKGIAKMAMVIESMTGSKVKKLSKLKTDKKGIVTLKLAPRVAASFISNKKLKVRAREASGTCVTKAVRVR